MKKVKIKEFADMCDVSIRTLKYYEELGLLTPYEVLKNGYRMYDITQLDDVSNILLLKDQGYSLKEIKDILNKQDLNSHYDSLQEQKQMIHKKMNQLLEKEKIIDYTSKHLELYFKYKDEVFIENIDQIINVEYFEKKKGTFLVISNYLTDGFKNGIIIDSIKNDVIGYYNSNQNGNIHLCGKCISCYSDEKQYDLIIHKMNEFANKNNIPLNHIYQETIIEMSKSNTYLIKYFMQI